MGLTPRKSGGQCARPEPIAVSALVESMTCPADAAPGSAGGTVSVWFKPAGTPGGVLTDQTRWHHMHMQGTAAAMGVTLNGAFHDTLDVSGANTYADVLVEVLTRCAGSAKGYLAQLHVLHDQMLGPGWFGRTIKGQWVPRRVGAARNFAPDPDFAESTAAGGWVFIRGTTLVSGGVDFSTGEPWAAVQRNASQDFMHEDRRLLICVTVGSQSCGTLRCFTYPFNTDGSVEENVGRPVTGPGHYRDVVFTDADSVNAGIQIISHPCDALLTRLDILDMDSGPAYGPGSSRLLFSDAAALGTDDSGNNGHWTLSGGEQSLDTPTNNLCVLNPADKSPNLTLSCGNLAAMGTDWASVRAAAHLPPDGRAYWEATSAGSQHVYGIATSAAPLDSFVGSDGFGYGIKPYAAKLYHNGVGTDFSISGYAPGHTLGFLWDGPSGTLSVIHENAEVGVMAQGLVGTWYPAHSCSSTAVADYNFGATPFVYDLPQGAMPLKQA